MNGADEDDTPVRSPCVRVCRLSTAGSGLCTGCWRSLEEITRWGMMSSDQRRAVLATLPTRARAHRRRLFKGPLFSRDRRPREGA